MGIDYPILKAILQNRTPAAVKIVPRSVPQSAVFETHFHIALKATQ